jgi:hypothetical protein
MKSIPGKGECGVRSSRYGLRMSTTKQYGPLPAPPLGRNWTDADVCAFHGFSSIELLMKMRTPEECGVQTVASRPGALRGDRCCM